MKKLVFGLVVAAATAAMIVPFALAGNSDSAKACQKGGWQTLARSQDNTAGFNSQDECVAYGAQGGTLVPKAAAVTQVSEPMFNLDATTCSVTVPVTPGIDTVLYGVNGYPETPITHAVTVTGGLDGANGTAPQFWIGYTAQPGYAITNPGTAPTHFDFYNGDTVRDC